MSFLLLLPLFPITQGLFLPKFIARIHSWKPYLMFVCGYKRVLGSLQVGRSMRYPAIIETPGTLLILVHYQCIFDALVLPTTLLLIAIFILLGRSVHICYASKPLLTSNSCS